MQECWASGQGCISSSSCWVVPLRTSPVKLSTGALEGQGRQGRVATRHLYPCDGYKQRSKCHVPSLQAAVLLWGFLFTAPVILPWASYLLLVGCQALLLFCRYLCRCIAMMNVCVLAFPTASFSHWESSQLWVSHLYFRTRLSALPDPVIG